MSSRVLLHQRGNTRPRPATSRGRPGCHRGTPAYASGPRGLPSAPANVQVPTGLGVTDGEGLPRHSHASHKASNRYSGTGIQDGCSGTGVQARFSGTAVQAMCRATQWRTVGTAQRSPAPVYNAARCSPRTRAEAANAACSSSAMGASSTSSMPSLPMTHGNERLTSPSP